MKILTRLILLTGILLSLSIQGAPATNVTPIISVTDSKPENGTLKYRDAAVAAFWSVCVSLASVMISNRHSRNLLVINLNHQATENAKKRAQDIKREIYLSLIEAASTAIAFLHRINSIPISEVTDAKPLSDLSRVLARLKVIAPVTLLRACFKSRRWGIEILN